ncbi:unnamed protein product [Sphagnum balticum]
MPTSNGEDPVQCASKLANFVKDNNLDGVDIDWEDNDAMEKGIGEEWLITFTQVLRDNLPTQYITHAPQAPYFKKEFYPKGGYVTVHKSVGSLINFYNVQFYNQAISYPVRLAYIDRINSFQTVQSIAAGMGIPGYAPANIYNYICLGYWTSSKGAQDIAEVWAEPLLYYNTTSPFGKTKEEIQKNIKKIYNDKGIKIFVSVFGPTEVPTTHALNATNLAIRLADFVSNNNLDGIDIDWEDSKALDSGYG